MSLNYLKIYFKISYSLIAVISESQSAIWMQSIDAVNQRYEYCLSIVHKWGRNTIVKCYTENM